VPVFGPPCTPIWDVCKNNMRGYKAYNFLALLLGNRLCHDKQFVPKQLRMSSSVTTQVWSGYDHRVMAHFRGSHYVPVWPWNLSHIPRNWNTRSGVNAEYMCLFSILWTFAFLKYAAIKCRIRGRISRKPALPWQPFVVKHQLSGCGYDHPVLIYGTF